MKEYFNKCCNYFVFFFISFLVMGCVNTRKATYFNGLGDGTITASTPVPESTIRPNDMLNISITSLDAAEALAPFNAPNISTSTISTTSGYTFVQGYLVAADGTIQFPMLGTLKVAGLTKEQLKQTITKEIVNRNLLNGPIVTIRFLNFRVTVLGEVKNPAVLSVPNEKISLLEAIGLAGDLTIYARRDNILVIREDENGNKDIKRIDLNSTELLSSPYYYLKSNDIVYVEPNKSRVASVGRGQQWIPALLSGLSLVAIVVDRIVKNN